MAINRLKEERTHQEDNRKDQLQEVHPLEENKMTEELQPLEIGLFKKNAQQI